MRSRAQFALAVTALAFMTAGATRAHAQGSIKGRRYAISSDDAVTATQAVLQRKGYEVVRLVEDRDTRVIYYRRIVQGGQDGPAPMERMIIRTVERRVVFEEVPSSLLEDIDQQLRL
jgi:hypothetical protein